MKQKIKKNPEILRVMSVEFCNGKPCVLHIEITDTVSRVSRSISVEKSRVTNQLEFGISIMVQTSIYYVTQSDINYCTKAFKRALCGDFSNMEF